MSELVITDLQGTVGGKQILDGVNLTVRSGEVHAVMGPNGSGKSTLSHMLAGRPGYDVTGGSATLDGIDLLALEPWQRAQAGLFLGMQYPIEVPGVSVRDLMAEALSAGGRSFADVEGRLLAEADRVGLDRALLDRSVNVDLSGGEKKRTETVQLAILAPKFALLDEIDSGLDVDALGEVSRRIEELSADGLGVVVITHYNRLLRELHADVVHVFNRGRILQSGGPELATELEATGYAAWALPDDRDDAAGVGESGPTAQIDPFADPFA